MFRFAQHDTRRNPGMKRVGIVLLQLLVTGAGLWYVFHDPQKRAQIADAVRQADRTWIIFGWLSYSAVLLAAAKEDVTLESFEPRLDLRFSRDRPLAAWQSS